MGQTGFSHTDDADQIHQQVTSTHYGANVGGPKAQPGIGNAKQQSMEQAQKEKKSSRDFSSVDAPGNAGAGPMEVLSAGKGYFSEHGTGTQLNKAGYDVGTYSEQHSVPSSVPATPQVGGPIPSMAPDETKRGR